MMQLAVCWLSCMPLLRRADVQPCGWLQHWINNFVTLCMNGDVQIFNIIVFYYHNILYQYHTEADTLTQQYIKKLKHDWVKYMNERRKYIHQSIYRLVSYNRQPLHKWSIVDPVSSYFVKVLHTNTKQGSHQTNSTKCRQMSWHYWAWSGGIGPVPVALTDCCPSVLWHCWLGHLTRKNRPRYDL